VSLSDPGLPPTPDQAVFDPEVIEDAPDCVIDHLLE
jgi:hypothetical protein